MALCLCLCVTTSTVSDSSLDTILGYVYTDPKELSIDPLGLTCSLTLTVALTTKGVCC